MTTRSRKGEPTPSVWSLGKYRDGGRTLTEHRADCGVVLRSRESPFTTVCVYNTPPSRVDLGPARVENVVHNCVAAPW